MKIGNISETVLKRTVVKAISYKNKKVISGTAVGSDGAVVNTNGKSVVATAAAGLFMPKEFFDIEIKRAIINAVNNVAVKKARPVAATLNIILPERLREISLYRIMEKATEVCKDLNIQIAGGNTDISDWIERPIVTITVLGELNGEIESRNEFQVGMDIVMAGYIATSATAMLANIKKDELQEYFSESYLAGALECENQMCIGRAAEIAVENSAYAMHDIGRGGINRALYDFSERMGKGVEIELSKIPVRQETIEITERYGLNPYKMISDGGLLIVTYEGMKMKEKLQESGIVAEVIGKLTDNNDKIYLKGEERRYIESPKDDDFFSII